MSQNIYLGLSSHLIFKKSGNILDFLKSLSSKSHKIKTRTQVINLRHISLGMGM